MAVTEQRNRFWQAPIGLMRTCFAPSVIASAAWQSRRRRDPRSIQRDHHVAALFAMTNGYTSAGRHGHGTENAEPSRSSRAGHSPIEYPGCWQLRLTRFSYARSKRRRLTRIFSGLHTRPRQPAGVANRVIPRRTCRQSSCATMGWARCLAKRESMQLKLRGR